MKFVFIVVLLIFIIIFALLIYFKFYFKNLVYKDLVYMLKYIKNSITFTKAEKSEIMNNLKNQISLVSRYTLSNIDSKLFYLNSFERGEVKNCIDSIGRGNVDYEINNIKYYESYFQDKFSISKEKLSKEGIVYMKVLIGIGVAICIILI